MSAKSTFPFARFCRAAPDDLNDELTDRDFLLAGAAWQDSLLQTYRSLHLAYQAITFAVAVGVFAAALAIGGEGTEYKLKVSALTSFVLLIDIGSFYLLRKMKAVVYGRGEDVNFWHRKLIYHENQLPGDQRHFTQFKVYQKFGRSDVDYLMHIFLHALPERQIKEADVDLLISKGLGHTRRVLDKNLFWGIAAAWVLLFLYAVTNLGWVLSRPPV